MQCPSFFFFVVGGCSCLCARSASRGSGGCRTAIQVCRTTFHVYCMVCGIWKVIFAFVPPLVNFFNYWKGEGAHTPVQCAGKFFSPGYGAAHGCVREHTRGSMVEFWGKSLRRNQPLVPRLNIASSWTRGGEGTISAIQALSQRPSTCEAHVSLSLFFKEKTQPHDAHIHASDSFSSGQLITRRLHRHGCVALRSRFLIELHSSHAPPSTSHAPPPPMSRAAPHPHVPPGPLLRRWLQTGKVRGGTAWDNICCTYTVITDPARLAEHLRRTCESEQNKKKKGFLFRTR